MIITNEYRTHSLGELRETDVGKDVTLSGWVDTIRDLGGVVFIDLRDQFGKTQITASEKDVEIMKIINKLTRESTIKITGTVVKRAPETVNPKIETGTVEVKIKTIEVLGKCKNVIPFEITDDNINVREELRLEYRFLDLRSKKIHDNIIFRAKVIKTIREKMDNLDFTEIQTPILANSSPEGARDFLVPSRLHPGKFYALPQAPQQFKQLLMASGFNGYYQIAPCFRDEDPRADRSPGEFYQLDLEMAFATQEDVFKVLEELIGEIFSKHSTKNIDKGAFKRIKFEEAMNLYGTDKPDLRNPLVLCDLSEIFKNSEFQAFSNKTVKAIVTTNTAEKPRSFFDDMVGYAVTECEAKGLAWVKVNADNTLTGPIAKFLDETNTKKLIEISKAKPNDAIFFLAGEKAEAERLAGLIRAELGKRLELIEENAYRFCWIVDFPMYEKNDEGKIDFSHNPFSMPQGGMDALNNKKALEIYAYQYDLVCNGYEIASGAVRNHDPEIMIKAFEIAGYTKEDVEKRFPALFNAFQYGPPPHAGAAPGIDRIVMLLKDEINIREVIAFPKNSKAQDLLMGAPSVVTKQQLRDVHIKLDTKED